MKHTLFSVTTKNLKLGIAKFHIMLLDAKTTKDMMEILPYCNIILNQLSYKKEKKLANEIFDCFWNRYEKLHYA